MRFVFVIVALAGCTADWEYTAKSRRVCISAADNGHTFRAGEPAQFTFWLQGCPVDYGMYCDATVTFDTIYVTAWMGWNDPLPMLCPRTAPPTHSCESPPLAPGTYKIAFDDYRRELTIPSTHDGQLCLDEWLEPF